MNDLFAVDPNSLAEDNGIWCKALYDKFGFHTGIFMANLPVDWRAQVKRNYTTNGLSKCCGEFLAQAKRRKFVIPLDHQEGLEDLSEILGMGQLAGVVGNSRFAAAPSVRDVIIGERTDLLAPQPDDTIQTQPAHFIDTFKPLILTSSELHLIDKYAFGFARRNLAVKESWYEFFRLVKALGEISPKPLYRFVIHLWDSVTSIPSREVIAQGLDDLNSYLAKQRGPDLEVLVIYSDESVPDDQHDRFLLAAHGGLSIGWGLHFSDRESTTYVNYLSEKQLLQQHKKFISGKKF